MDVIVCECGHCLDRTGPSVTCEICGTEHLSIAVSDVLNVALAADTLVVKLQGERAVGVRMIGDSGRDISTDLQAGGQTASSIRARPRPNEQNVPEVARVFREHLNRAGAAWQDPEICASVSATEERGVDFVLRDGVSSLDCQVVRPACEKDSLWPRVARGETVQTTHDFAEAAEELRNAVAQKAGRIPPRGRASITLVVDSIETPAFALKDVLSEFRHLHGGWASSLGFAAIWVVGPTSDLTTKLA